MMAVVATKTRIEEEVEVKKENCIETGKMT